jgi:hypothetical protein
VGGSIRPSLPGDDGRFVQPISRVAGFLGNLWLICQGRPHNLPQLTIKVFFAPAKV